MGRGEEFTMYIVLKKSVDTGEQTFETHNFKLKYLHLIVVSDYQFYWISWEAKIYGNFIFLLLSKYTRLLQTIQNFPGILISNMVGEDILPQWMYVCA